MCEKHTVRTQDLLKSLQDKGEKVRILSEIIKLLEILYETKNIA